jgi:hypothetical protein
MRSSTTSSLASFWAKVPSLPLFGGFHDQIPERTQFSDISVFCLVIPEILKWYCDIIAMFEFMRLFQSQSGWIDFQGNDLADESDFFRGEWPSKHYPDPETPPISLEFSECISCRTGLLQLSIRLICQRTAFREFPPQSPFLESDAMILSNRWTVHQKHWYCLKKSA